VGVASLPGRELGAFKHSAIKKDIG
jgi:hypothetical protein